MPKNAGDKALEIKSAFQSNDFSSLKALGNECIQVAVIENDHVMAKLSVIAYSLYKMISKQHIVRNSKWPKAVASMTNALEKSASASRDGREEEFERQLNNVIRDIELVDNELSNFARNIFEKAKIKQASTAYASGLSMQQAASLTGASPKELQFYIGVTRIHDEQPVHKNIRQRIDSLRDLP